jgi:phage gp16-like protein
MRLKDARARELATIHVAKAQLAIDDATYRDLLWTLCRVRSAADLDAHGRRAVIEHFKSHGWTQSKRGRPRPAADRIAMLQKAYALLGTRPVAYAEGILQQMYGASAPVRLEWADKDQLRKVIAALTYDAKRHPRPQRDETPCS